MKEFVEKLIERLEELRVRNFLTIANTGDDKLDCAYEYVGKVLDNTISIINELAEEYSAITPQNSGNGWIPCSERLPDKDLYVLCQGNHSIFIACIDSLDNKWRDDHYYTRTTIKAWQPLPQPYKEGSADNA